MSITTELMLTCAALTEEAETPVGHCGAFGPVAADEPTEPGSFAAEIEGRKLEMIRTIGLAVKMLEDDEQRVTDPPASDLYAGMRRLADEEEAKRWQRP